MARPNRPKAIPDLDPKTSMQTGDLLLLTRLTAAPDDYENFRINWDDFIASVQSNLTIQTTADELVANDRLALEYFDDYALGPITVADGGSGWSGNGVISSGTIVQRTMRGSLAQTQQRLALGNTGQYVRRFSWGDNWQRMSFGLLWRLNRASSFGPSRFFFGICSGTANPVGGTCDNFTGMMGPNSGATDATFTTGTVANYFDLNPSIRFGTKRGSTVTDRTSGSGSNGRHIAASEGVLAILFVEVNRPVFALDSTSVTYSYGVQQSDATRVQNAAGKHALPWCLMQDGIGSSMASANGIAQFASSGLAGVTTSYSFDQSTGKLDCLNFYWDQSFDAELAAIGAFKIL